MLAGSDFVFSGFGSVQRYDNMFGPSNFNAEDIDDFLAMQRDWGIDGGLRTVAPGRLLELRREAAQACADVYRYLGLADLSHVELAADAAGSKDLGDTDTLAVLTAAHAIRQRGLTVVDIVAALDECGYPDYAERTLRFAAARLAGDYLQTSAIFDEQLTVLSAVTDPNDYAGPGTGYVPTAARQAEIDAIRQVRTIDDLRAEQAHTGSARGTNVSGHLLARPAKGAGPGTAGSRTQPLSCSRHWDRPPSAPIRAMSSSASRPRSRSTCGNACRACR